MRLLHTLVAVVATTVSVAIVYVPQSIFAEIASDLSISAVDARESFTVSALCYALAFFVFGPLSDVLSPRTLGSFGAIATALFGSLAACVNSFSMFIAAVAATGIFAASVPAAMFALAGRAQSERSGRYFGFILAATVAGITIGRGIGALIAGEIGWRWAYAVFAVAILVLGLSSLALPRDHRRELSIGGAYLAAMRMMVRPAVLSYLTIGGALFLGYLGITTVLTLRLSSPPMSLDATAIGVISLSGLVALAGAPLAGTLVPRIGAKNVSLLGLAVCVVGVATIGLAATPWTATIGLLVLYLGVFAAQPALMVRLTQLVGHDLKGSASASYFLVCLLAGSLGGSVLGWIWQHCGWSFAAGTAIVTVVLALVVATARRDKGTHNVISEAT